jgi:hypothetical protein
MRRRIFHRSKVFEKLADSCFHFCAGTGPSLRYFAIDYRAGIAGRVLQSMR